MMAQVLDSNDSLQSWVDAFRVMGSNIRLDRCSMFCFSMILVQDALKLLFLQVMDIYFLLNRVFPIRAPISMPLFDEVCIPARRAPTLRRQKFCCFWVNVFLLLLIQIINTLNCCPKSQNLLSRNALDVGTTAIDYIFCIFSGLPLSIHRPLSHHCTFSFFRF